jgi:hypothetical protein
VKILVFTDSRGQHKPAQQTHLIFGERLKADPRLKIDLFMCPMKWTTTLDFLELFPEEKLQDYEATVLYTGIVDWSPRRLSSAINDLYDNHQTSNTANVSVNTNDYSKKVVNSKKRMFNAVFTENAMRRHFERPFESSYEGEQTANMYSLEMASASLLPRLLRIPNLIYVSANRFVSGWNGDYPRTRPENITVTHAYSDLFSEQLRQHLIDLRSWDDTDVRHYTCDNIHLTKAGSEFIYDRICSILDLNSRRGIVAPATRAAPESIVQTTSSMDTFIAANRALRQGLFSEAFQKALKLFEKSGRSSHFHTAFRAAIAMNAGEDVERVFSAAEKNAPTDVAANHADQDYLRRFQFLLPWSVQQRVLELAKRPALTAGDLNSLEEKLLKPAPLYEFVDGRSKVVRARMNDEFRFITRFKLPFPYNYLSDYRGNSAVSRSSTLPHVRSVSFIYPVKDRSRRLALSLQSLARAVERLASRSSLSVDVVVAEDQSTDVVSPDLFKRLPFDCTHCVVDTGMGWTRSGLINQGIKMAKGEFVFFTDADVLFTETSLLELADAFAAIDVNRHMLAINMFETHTHTKEDRFHSAGMPYSYMWGLLRKNAAAVGGFNEAYVGWGSEDRDFEFRVCKKLGLMVLSSLQLPRAPFVLHLSHDVRTGAEGKEANKRRLQAVKAAATDQDGLVVKPTINMKVVSSQRYRTSYDLRARRADLFLSPEDRRGKTLIILGNGPSLREVMECRDLLDQVRSFDSFGLNAAYRAYERFDFYPTYFGSFDFRVCDSHADSFSELVRGNTPIKRFFFAKQSVFSEEVKAHPKFQRINFRAAPRGVSQQATLSTSFENFEDCGSSGTNAIQAGYLMGYRRFILLGVDCNYVELLDGVKDVDGIRYEVVDEIKSNPNYWFDDYQRRGDQFHKPNEKEIQLVSWAKLDSLVEAAEGSVSNCSLVSKLPMFDILSFRKATTHCSNVFLVISCEKYRSRVEALRRRYANGLRSGDLVLFVVGGGETTRLDENGVLTLAAGDRYEDLPQKIQAAIEFCVNNLDFERLIKVDDDVFINFENFYQALERATRHPYVGRRTPTRPGVKPSAVWHFGKVGESSLYDGLPYEIEPPPEMWAGGGMYMLSREAACHLAGPFARRLANHHLYEDFMVGDALARYGIAVTPWDQLGGEGTKDWCITNLQEIFSKSIDAVTDVDRVRRAISVHCGPYQPYYGMDESQMIALFNQLEGLT